MSEHNFREEIRRLSDEVKQLRGRISGLENHIVELEKRELLRFQGSPYCRICKSGRHGQENPPISELEQKYHDAGHAAGIQVDPSTGLSGYRATANWDDLESIITDGMKAAVDKKESA